MKKLRKTKYDQGETPEHTSYTQRRPTPKHEKRIEKEILFLKPSDIQFIQNQNYTF